MKKLIVMFAAAAMAVGAQAAAVNWSTGVFDGPDGSSSNRGSKYSGVYEALFTVFSDAAGTDVLGSNSTQDTKKAGTMVGSVDIAEPANGVTKTYYAQMVITDIASGKQLESSIGSFTWTGGDLAAPEVVFYGEGASGWATGGAPSASASGWATPGSGGGGGGEGVPEPTSGLLLLVGGAMLALRRKQK